MKPLLRTLLAASLVAGACGRLPEGPTEPEPEPERGPVAPAPPAPANPLPGPTPVLGSPVSSPSPTPPPGDDESEGEPGPNPSPAATPGPAALGCFRPHPPEISRFNVKIHVKGPEFWTLDTTPLVGPNPEYCAQIGYTDSRSFCPVRPDGHPEREPCEAWAVGTAVDTGRSGPTWTRDGRFCTGRASGCENSPDNQYQVRAFLAGVYRACARNGACGEETVDR